MIAEDHQIEEFLSTHTQWELKQGKLYRQFTFGSFTEAFGFMTQVALIAEKQDHHPDWHNSYRTVQIWLTTHQFKGITERDFALVRAIDEIAAS